MCLILLEYSSILNSLCIRNFHKRCHSFVHFSLQYAAWTVMLWVQQLIVSNDLASVHHAHGPFSQGIAQSHIEGDGIIQRLAFANGAQRWIIHLILQQFSLPAQHTRECTDLHSYTQRRERTHTLLALLLQPARTKRWKASVYKYSQVHTMLAKEANAALVWERTVE